MSRGWRIFLFVFGAAGLAAAFAALSLPLPGPSSLRSRYLEAINSRTVPERHATDAVSAVNFDYRGFDTLGEEFILFVSVSGAMVLLREGREQHGKLLPDGMARGREVAGSDAVRLWVLAMLAPKILFGLYVVTHGQLTPGGGFQGGVILATAAFILYLGDGFDCFRRVVPHGLVEIGEAMGAGGYVAIGLLAFLSGREFLTNFLPLGRPGQVTAAGTMPVISLLTGLEVTAGFTLLMFSFLQETLTPKEDIDE
ncbi:MAG TPA: MnhB domain-containing protein [Opitutaceae bacterium]|jgi:multicomponent Na+:H+ antiporter subunit B|nr:MnhB domain-containing protein [Opitutaceae bacterium]